MQTVRRARCTHRRLSQLLGRSRPTFVIRAPVFMHTRHSLQDLETLPTPTGQLSVWMSESQTCGSPSLIQSRCALRYVPCRTPFQLVYGIICTIDSISSNGRELCSCCVRLRSWCSLRSPVELLTFDRTTPSLPLEPPRQIALYSGPGWKIYIYIWMLKKKKDFPVIGPRGYLCRQHPLLELP